MSKLILCVLSKYQIITLIVINASIRVPFEEYKK